MRLRSSGGGGARLPGVGSRGGRRRPVTARRVPLAARRAELPEQAAAVAALRLGALQQRAAVETLADDARDALRRRGGRAEEHGGARAEERALRVDREFEQIAALIAGGLRRRHGHSRGGATSARIAARGRRRRSGRRRRRGRGHTTRAHKRCNRGATVRTSALRHKRMRPGGRPGAMPCTAGRRARRCSRRRRRRKDLVAHLRRAAGRAALTPAACALDGGHALMRLRRGRAGGGARGARHRRRGPHRGLVAQRVRRGGAHWRPERRSVLHNLQVRRSKRERTAC